jgi:hypothetical protein
LNERINNIESEKYRMEKEILTLRDDIKKTDKDKKDNESKVNKVKEVYEKQLTELKSNLTKLQSRNNFLAVDKKNLEERLNKLNESYSKVVSKNIKALNGIEMIDSLKKNDILKSLSKIKGTEKLLETLKFGFNESVRELLFEITALKNFILEMNKEMQIMEKPFVDIDSNLMNMPFLDTIGKIKYIFKSNLYRLKDEKFDSHIGVVEEISLEHNPIFKEEDEIVEKVSHDEDGMSELEILKNKWQKMLK